MTGNRIMRQGIAVVAMIVVTSYIIKQTANVFAQCIIQDYCRATFILAHPFRLGKQVMEAALVDLLFNQGASKDRAIDWFYRRSPPPSERYWPCSCWAAPSDRSSSSGNAETDVGSQ